MKERAAEAVTLAQNDLGWRQRNVVVEVMQVHGPHFVQLRRTYLLELFKDLAVKRLQQAVLFHVELH